MNTRKIMLALFGLLTFGISGFSQQFDIGHHGKHAGGLGAPLMPADYANYSTVIFENGWLNYAYAGTIIDPATTDANIHVLVVDEYGVLLWEMEYGNVGTEEIALDVVYDPNNDYLVLTGMVNDDMYVATLDAFTGTVISDNTYTGFDPSGTSFSGGTNILCSQSGNYVVGGFYTTVTPSGNLMSSEAVVLEIDNTLNIVQTMALSRSGMPNGNDCSINDIVEIDGLGYFVTGSYESGSPSNDMGVLAVFLDPGTLTISNNLSFYDPNGADCRGVSASYDRPNNQISLLSNHDATGNAQLRTIDVSGTPSIIFSSDLRLDLGGVPFRGSGFQIMNCPWDPSSLIIAGRSAFLPWGVENRTWFLEMEKATHTFLGGMIWEIPMPVFGYQGLAYPNAGALFTYNPANVIHPTIFNPEIITNRWDDRGIVAITPTDIMAPNYGIDLFATEFMTVNACFEPINCTITDMPETVELIMDNALTPTAASGIPSLTVMTGVDDICPIAFAPIQEDEAQDGDAQGTSSITENKIAIAVAPNPSNGMFTVSVNGSESGTFVILNSMGQIVYRSSQISGANYVENVDLSAFENGIYILRFTNGTSEITQKLIKLR